jgi:hypothetical protein
MEEFKMDDRELYEQYRGPEPEPTIYLDDDSCCPDEDIEAWAEEMGLKDMIRDEDYF